MGSIGEMFMVTHLEQIYKILQYSITTYTINTNTQQAIAPSINISYMKPEKPHYATKDEIYQLHIKATSVENREAIVNTLLQFDTRYPNGYNISDPFYEYVTAEFDSIDTNAPPLTYTFHQNEGLIGVGSLGEAYDSIVRAEFTAKNIESIAVLLTPNETNSADLTIAFYGKDEYYTIETLAQFLTTLSIITGEGYIVDTGIDIGTWINNIEVICELPVISAAFAGSISKISVLLRNYIITEKKIFDAARFRFTLSKEGYPYYLEMDMVDEWDTEAILLLKARWAI